MAYRRGKLGNEIEALFALAGCRLSIYKRRESKGRLWTGFKRAKLRSDQKQAIH